MVMIVLTFGLLAGCGSVVQQPQEAASISDRVRSEKEVQTVRGITWRPEVIEAFRSCASTFDIDGTGRRAAAFVNDWLVAAKSLDECDTKSMELVTNFYSRIKNLLSTAYGSAQGEACNRVRVDLLVDVDGVANTIGSRLGRYENQCREKVASEQDEDRRRAFQQRLDDMMTRAGDFINRRPMSEK
ncbi:MAG TPA: hypothetical protein VGO49_04110 [Bradyrhizobium sp.]|nr:hypothetical protein [Bradyrhizobium sp.]